MKYLKMNQEAGPTTPSSRENPRHMTASQDQLHLGLVQMSCGPNPADNLEKAVRGIRQAAQAGAQVICLQELFRSLYFCQRQDPALFDLAESIPGPSTERLSRVARETGVVVVASLFE